MLVGQRAVDAVRLLRHHVDPTTLIAARETGIGTTAGHVIEHSDVFGDADRIGGRQHDAELPHANALGLHREVEVEQHRIVRELEALDVEVVLGEGNRVVAELVAQFDLLGQLFQHALIELRVHARHALLDLGTAGDRRQVEERRLHCSFPPSYATEGGTVPGLGSMGRSLSRPSSFSYSDAACRSAASPRGLPTSCRPTSRPNESKPQGTAIAGLPETVIAELSVEPAM